MMPYLKGSSDGGAHIEGMRQSGMTPGGCELRATGCTGFSRLREFHHESYRPERGIYVCHHCHHLTHFRPWSLTRLQKMKLLMARHGDVGWGAFQKKPKLIEGMLQRYVAPGRRPAQLKVRKEVRRRLKTFKGPKLKL